jgi:CubicO group peptidase (beta-lactamase class C family)
MERGLHVGAQVCVRYRGELVADYAIGLARGAHPLRTDHRMLWLSAGKPLLAVAICQLVEQGLLGLDDCVSEYIPEFAAHGKSAITVQHLLTHTHGYQPPLLDWPRLAWKEIISSICAARVPEGRVPGEYAAYDPQTGWYLLAEILQRRTGEPYFERIRRTVLEPCGLRNSSLGMPADKYQQLLDADRLAPLHDTGLTAKEGKLGEDELPAPTWAGETAARAAARNPGGGAIGPAYELCTFYQVLSDLWNGTAEVPLLLPETVRLMTRRVRAGLMDHTFKQCVDWGLGFLINSYRYGKEATPYGYGRHASDSTFGHGGVQSTSAWADPGKRVTGVIVFNGLCGEPKHNKRVRDVNSLLYTEIDAG